MTRSEDRGVTIPFDDGSEAGRALEGIFVPVHDGSGQAAVIAPPHPLYGGSMDNPVVTEIAHACTRTGLASLRFNWRGVGASGGRASGEATDAVADYAAAIEQMAETVEGDLVAAGYSFGAVAALRCASRFPRVRRLVLVAPPPSLLGTSRLSDHAGPMLVATGVADPLAPPAVLAEALDSCPHARLVVVPEADHFFQAGLAELGRTVRDWLEP